MTMDPKIPQHMYMQDLRVAGGCDLIAFFMLCLRTDMHVSQQH